AIRQSALGGVRDDRADRREDHAIDGRWFQARIELAGACLEFSVWNRPEGGRLEGVKQGLNEARLASAVHIGYGGLYECRRGTISADLAVDDLPLTLRLDRFRLLSVISFCALVHRLASDGTAHVPERRAVPPGDFEGHG